MMARTKPLQPISAVVPVHNAFQHVDSMLSSLIPTLTPDDELIVVNDGSDWSTRTALVSLLRPYSPQVVLLHSTISRGYSRAVARGVAKSTRGQILIANSDTIFPPRALTRMRLHLENRSELAGIGPLSNAAGFQSIPRYKPTYAESLRRQTPINRRSERYSVAEIDFRLSVEARSFVATSRGLHGFCQLIRRDAWEAVGGLDLGRFPRGYGEENDFYMRLFKQGLSVGIAADTYVYHHKTASFLASERSRLVGLGKNAILAKHGKEAFDEYRNSLVMVAETVQSLGLPVVRDLRREQIREDLRSRLC